MVWKKIIKEGLWIVQVRQVSGKLVSEYAILHKGFEKVYLRKASTKCGREMCALWRAFQAEGIVSAKALR